MHQWGRLVAITAGIYCVWASIWSFFFRKFFWDMVGGVLGPVGLIPPPSASIFIHLIVDIPLIQSITLINGLLTVIFEYPMKPIRVDSMVHRSHMFKVAFYFWCAIWASLPYQTVDSAVYYMIAMIIYLRAQISGEQFVLPNGQRARGDGGGSTGKVMV